MARRGRPFALDDVKRGEIVALITAGYGLSDAARYVGCSVNTINRDAQRDANFHKRMREAYLAAEPKPLQALRQAATHHWRAAAWLLQRVNPDRYVRKKEGTYNALDVDDLISQFIHCVAPDIPDRDAYERIARRIESVRTRWEYDRVKARAMLTPKTAPITDRDDPKQVFPLLGHAVYKIEK